MGKIPSASTLSSIAYLTESGRRYLYGKDKTGLPIRFNEDGTDNFEILNFALFDGDRNYKVSNNFETGEMPDIAGTSDNSCLKTSSDISKKSSIVYRGEIVNSSQENIDYNANPPITGVNLDTLGL